MSRFLPQSPEYPLRGDHDRDALAASIQRKQRAGARAPQPGSGVKQIISSEGTWFEDEHGNRWPRPPSVAEQRDRDVRRAREALERAVAEDFSSAMDAYVDLCDALYRAGSVDSTPPFSDLVDQAAAKAAAARRRP